MYQNIRSIDEIIKVAIENTKRIIAERPIPIREKYKYKENLRSRKKRG